jgi:transposase
MTPLHVLQLDQASFHLTRSLTLPAKIILLFQPAKSPELNPIERLWQHLKDRLAWVGRIS